MTQVMRMSQNESRELCVLPNPHSVSADGKPRPWCERVSLYLSPHSLACTHTLVLVVLWTLCWPCVLCVVAECVVRLRCMFSRLPWVCVLGVLLALCTESGSKRMSLKLKYTIKKKVKAHKKKLRRYAKHNPSLTKRKSPLPLSVFVVCGVPACGCCLSLFGVAYDVPPGIKAPWW